MRKKTSDTCLCIPVCLKMKHFKSPMWALFGRHPIHIYSQYKSLPQVNVYTPSVDGVHVDSWVLTDITDCLPSALSISCYVPQVTLHSYAAGRGPCCVRHAQVDRSPGDICIQVGENMAREPVSYHQAILEDLYTSTRGGCQIS